MNKSTAVERARKWIDKAEQELMVDIWSTVERARASYETALKEEREKGRAEERKVALAVMRVMKQGLTNACEYLAVPESEVKESLDSFKAYEKGEGL